MTVMAERASDQMSVDLFERIAEFAAREDETVSFEFIGGRIEVKKVADARHGEIAMWQCIRNHHRATPFGPINSPRLRHVPAQSRRRRRC